MRWNEFKNILIESEQDDDENILPSKTMAGGEISKTATGNPDEYKYLKAIGDSIDKNKTFSFATQPNPKSDETKAKAYHGIIDKVVLEMPGDKEFEVKPKDGSNVTVGDLFWVWSSNMLKEKGAAEVQKQFSFYSGGTKFKLNQMYKTDAATGEMRINKGDAAEAILGAAITAKFEAGGKSINAQSVITLLQEVVQKGKIERLANYDVGQGDQIFFRLTLNAVSMSSLKMWMGEVDPMDSNVADFQIVQKGVADKTIKDLQRYVRNSVEYANNNKRAETAVNRAKADPGKNIVEVISDGGDATNQTSTKVDLKITYDGQATRLLSLKAGSVKQFGQGSGAEWDTVSNFFETVLKFKLEDNMKTKFKFKDPSEDPDYKNYNYAQGPFEKLYAEMAKQVKVYTKGDNLQQEYNLVKNVYDGINFHATRGEEGVTMVILAPSTKIAYKELAFDTRLLKALDLYDLRVINEPGKANHYLHVVGILKTDKARAELGDDIKAIGTKSILVSMRSSMNAGAVRNAVEMGDLLKDLADVEKLDKQHAQDQLQQQPEKSNGIQSMIDAGNAKADAEVKDRQAPEKFPVNDPNATIPN